LTGKVASKLSVRTPPLSVECTALGPQINWTMSSRETNGLIYAVS